MPISTKINNWLFTHRYSLLTAFFGFICAFIGFTLLVSLGLVDVLSFSMKMLPWEMLTTMAASSYVAGGLLASFTLPFFPIKPLKSSSPTITRFTDALSGVFFPIAVTGLLIWRGVKFLLFKLIASVAKWRYGNLPLHRAAEYNDVVAVKALIENGADVNAAQGNAGVFNNFGRGKVPLHLAATFGNVAVVKTLVENGANVNAPQVNPGNDNNGMTALHIAAYTGHDEVVNALIERGADVYAPQVNHGNRNNGMTALHWAARNDRVAVVKTLIENGADVNATRVNPGEDNNGMTALHITAYWGGRLEVLNALIERGADVNAPQVNPGKDDNGMTALHIAAATGWSVDVINALIAGGASVNAAQVNPGKENNGMTALHYAAKKDHLAVVNALIVAGANVAAVQVNPGSGNHGMTALHYAACMGRVEVVNALIVAGADVHAGQVNPGNSHNGMTALHHAARMGSVDAVESLIAAGANINATDAAGRTPIVVAYERGYNHTNLYPNIVGLLEHHGAVLPARYRQQRIEAGRRVDASKININGSQSTHTASVHDDVTTSITKLKKRYNEIDVKKTLEEIMDWIEQYKESKEDKLRLAYEGFYRSISIDFADARSGITLVEALAYVWCGVNDEEQIKERLNLSEEEWQDAEKVQTAIAEMKQERRNDYLQHLYERKAEYNLDAHGNKIGDEQGMSAEGCTSGGFNKIVETLNGGKHDDVLIRVMRKEQAVVKVPVLLAQKLLHHGNEQEKHDWACAWYQFPAKSDADEQGGKTNVAGPSEAMAEQFHGVILEELTREFGHYVTEIDIQDAADYVHCASPSQSIKEYVKVVTVLSNVLHAYAHQLNHHANQQEKLRWERGWQLTKLPGEQMFNHFEQAVFTKIREAFKAEIISGKKLEQILALLKYAITRKTGKGKAPENAEDEVLNDICEKLGGYLTKETLLGICDYFTEVAPILPRVEQKVEPKGKEPEHDKGDGMIRASSARQL